VGNDSIEKRMEMYCHILSAGHLSPAEVAPVAEAAEPLARMLCSDLVMTTDYLLCLMNAFNLSAGEAVGQLRRLVVGGMACLDPEHDSPAQLERFAQLVATSGSCDRNVEETIECLINETMRTGSMRVAAANLRIKMLREVQQHERGKVDDRGNGA